jgi:GT2 family glycosyltransferase
LFKKENEGVSLTRNFGVSKAATDHIAFLDADDLWEVNHLEQLYKLIERYPDAGLYAAAYQKKFSAQLTQPMDSPLLTNTPGWTGYVDNFFEASLIDCVAWTSAVAMPKKIFEDLKGFDARITHGAGEDTDLWVRVALHYKVAFSNTITATHIMDSDNRISNTPTLKRSYMDLDAYDAFAKANPSLRRFLDINRFSFALQHKMAGDAKSSKIYQAKIAPENLTSKQKALLNVNGKSLIRLRKFQDFLRNKQLYLSPFKR